MNARPYVVCGFNKNEVFINSPAEPKPQTILRHNFLQMMESGEITISAAPSLQSEFDEFDRAISKDRIEKAIAKQCFLEFRATHKDARPEDFGLKPVTERQVQRWIREFEDSKFRYGVPYYGLLGKRRTGRHRNEYPEECLNEAKLTLETLYFTKVRRSLVAVFREFRRAREERNLICPSRKWFRRFADKLKPLDEKVASREGKKAAYQYSRARLGGINWVLQGDYNFMVTQMDGKQLDIEVVDEVTGIVLGKPVLIAITLPHLGSAPVGWALLLEQESYRGAMMAYRDMIERFGQRPTFLIVDNGRAFNNICFDQLLASFGTSKINRLKNDPRFSSEIESLWETMREEVIGNLVGNSKAHSDIMNMTRETDPKVSAVWTFSKLYEYLEEYLFTMLWDAPSAMLGCSPRTAFSNRLKYEPDREKEFLLPTHLARVAFLPTVKGTTREIQPGRGVYVYGYYYWSEAMKHHAWKKVEVRYDPYELYIIFILLDGEWVECEAKHAPELRGVTEKARRAEAVVRRHIINTHAARRDATHGRHLAQILKKARDDEAVLMELRKANAQRISTTKTPPTTPTRTTSKPSIPVIDFSSIENCELS